MIAIVGRRLLDSRSLRGAHKVAGYGFGRSVGGIAPAEYGTHPGISVELRLAPRVTGKYVEQPLQHIDRSAVVEQHFGHDRAVGERLGSAT